MHLHPNAELTLEQLPNGEHAWLRPDTHTTAAWASRASWPTFIVESGTRYRVAAPSVERVQQWFDDTSDTDLDVETIDFGEIRIFAEPPELPAACRTRRYWRPARYVLTDLGRRELAMSWLFDPGPTVADVIAARTALGNAAS